MRSSWQRYYCREHDETGLVAEANILRYVPLDRVEVRHGGDADRAPLTLLRIAAEVSGVPLGVSTPRRIRRRVRDVDSRRGDVRPTASGCSPGSTTTRDGSCTPPTSPSTIADPVADPMIELQRWVREQAISRTLHRHGRLTRLTARVR